MTRKVYIKDGVEYYDNYLISIKWVSILEGKILTIVELLGLPETQSEALKSELRQKIWGGTFEKHGRLIFANEVPTLLEKVGELEKNRFDQSIN